MAALSEKIFPTSSVEMFEMMAARWAVQFIVKLGFFQYVFEGDFEVQSCC